MYMSMNDKQVVFSKHAWKRIAERVKLCNQKNNTSITYEQVKNMIVKDLMNNYVISEKDATHEIRKDDFYIRYVEKDRDDKTAKVVISVLEIDLLSNQTKQSAPSNNALQKIIIRKNNGKSEQEHQYTKKYKLNKQKLKEYDINSEEYY